MSPWFAFAAAAVAGVIVWHVVRQIESEIAANELRAESLARWERELDRREAEAAKWFDQ